MQTIIVDTTPGFRMPTVFFSQGDIGRTFSIDLQSRFGDSLPASPTVTIQATKPSGLGFSVASTSLSGSVATFTVTDTMTNEAGRFPAEIKVVKNSVTLYTANFYIECEASAHPEGTTDGDLDSISPKFMSVTVTTLDPGDSATYTYDPATNTATFGIPKGEPGDDGTLSSNVIATTYSSSSTYGVGDFCFYNGSLYKCTTAITAAEAWTAGHWSVVNVTDEITDLKDDLDDYVLIENNTTVTLTSTAGVIRASGTIDYTQYSNLVHYNVDVEEGQVYTIFTYSQGTTIYPFCVFWDSNNTSVGKVDSGDNAVVTKTVTVPIGAVSMSINNNTNTAANPATCTLNGYKKITDYVDEVVADYATTNDLDAVKNNAFSPLDNDNLVDTIFETWAQGESDGTAASYKVYQTNQIECSEGDIYYVAMVAETTMKYLACGFFDSDDTSLGRQFAYTATSGNFARNTVTAPANTAYMMISISTGDSSVAVTPSSWTSSVHLAYVGKKNITSSDELYGKYEAVGYTKYNALEERVEVLEDGSSSDIIILNASNYNKFIEQALRPYNQPTWGYMNEPTPLALIHFSDIHGGTENTQRLLEFYNTNDDKIDDIICSGDIVTNHAGNGMTWWSAISGAENIILCIGNHDALSQAGYESADYTQLISQSDQYDEFIAPYYSNWGLSSDPSTNSLTYFYKDYSANNVRVIFLNCMLRGADDTAQQTWLTSVLSSAKSAGLHVVIVAHCYQPSSTDVECNWTSIDGYLNSTYFTSDDYGNIVDAFIGDGGKFACWLTGHTHIDVLKKYVGENGTQLIFVVDSGNITYSDAYTDIQRTVGKKSQDLANLVVIDPSSEIVKVLRIGADITRYLRPRHILTIKYDGTIIQQN